MSDGKTVVEGAMSEADRLLEAARLMREQHGPEHERHWMWVAMAEWLEVTVRTARQFSTMSVTVRFGWGHAVEVADAYLAAVPQTEGDPR